LWLISSQKCDLQKKILKVDLFNINKTRT